MDRRRAAAALLALAACIACSAAAPMASNHTALELHDGPIEGCYYNFQHYGEGDRIMTNEPCLNCTCHNRMLMCYLRVCPFTKAIGQDCTVEKRADQCCPIVTCPDVPVDLLTSTSTSSPAEYGATGIGKLDKYGCSIHGKYFPEGSKVPPTPNKPCEHCYCIRNMTTCVMQECTLHVDGCTPIYHKDVCCPVRYSCDHPEDEIPLLDDMTTTVRPTQGFLLTTTTMSPVTQISQACVHDDQIFADGALIRTEKACEHCYCMKGDIVCVVQECGTPMENEGKNCTSLPPRHGQCCPDTYICEGDERVTDTTTEFGVLTSLPPRRVGVEGSGYRNEPDEAYTEISPIATEIEGSGEDFATGTQMYTGENVTPEKEFIDETLLTTTDTNLHLSQSTEPDKGQNTIPDSVTNKEAAQEPIENELSSSSFGETMTTATKDYTTVKDLTSRKEEIGTTESVFKTDSESNLAETLTSEEHEKATSESTHLLETTTFTDEIIPYTNPTISESDKKATTLPSTEYTTVQDTSKLEELSTELHVHSDVTEKDTDIFHITPESEILIESTTYPITNIVVAESTSINPNINEIDDNGSLLPTPSRIPGEGDCLLNGITYTNNTNVPSTNNCHTGCKCISSIIKCDPIICSPPPEYMENMNDCQPIYDTPNSCCPTYVCSVQETIPPESHSHMSGTESPKPIAATECSGNDCNDVEDNKLPSEATICTSDNCLSETPAIEKECESNDCTDQTSPSIPTQDCSDGKCQILPVVPCEGENCKDAIPETDNTEPTKTTAVQEKCESNDCKDQVQTTPSKPSQECSDGKCEISPTTLCEGEKCAAEKDLESGSQDVPPKICNDENGCDDSNIIIVPKECVGETCKRKDFPEEKVPLKCSGSDCKQHDEQTVQSTEQATELVTEGSTITDINLQKTETLESHITSSDELATESVTKQPIHIESPEILSTTLEQIVTESPDKYDMGKETIQTDGPSIQTITEIAEEVVKEALPNEPPKSSVDKTTESQDIASPTDEQITSEIHFTYTKEPEYLETDTKEAFTKENELLSTDKPHIYTDSHTLDEIHTKLPEISETESEKSPTEPPELVISGTDGIKMESPESTTQKEVFVTNPSEKIATEKETIHSTATETSITVTEAIQTTSFEKITEKEMKQPETLEAITEKEVMGTEVPDLVITQKEQAMETFTDRADTQTEVPETYATGNDVIVTETSKVTVEDKQIIQTEIPEIVDAIQETSQTESPAIIDFEKITIETVNPDIAITTKYPIVIESELPTFTEKMQTMYPDATIIIKDEVLTDITEATIRKEDGYTPDLHKTKIESTTEHELDQSLLEEQTSISSNLGTDEDESVYVTKETIPKPKVTEKPEITDEDKEHDESHEPKSTTADEKTEISTESLVPYTTYEIVTERIEPENTKPERMPEDIHIGVTESISEPTLSGTVGETTTKQIHKVTEEAAIYTKLPHGTETEEEAVTDKNLSYTSIPDVDETKSDDSSQSIDMSVTESQVTVTKAPEMLLTQNAEIAEISTMHDAIVTDKYKEVSDREPESTLLPINEITEKQDQHTEAPEKDSTILQAQDKTTILPEQYTTLEETILTTEKGPHKQYETPSSDSNLEEDKKDTEKIHRTTLKNIEELATTEISNFVTEIPELHLTEPSTDQKFDSESSLLTTKIEENVKELESSTVLMTDIGKTQAPEFIEVIEQDLTSKIPQQDIATESYEEITSENLPSHSTYKEELPTEQPLSQETSNTKAGTELYIETSTKTITENEKEKEDQVTTSKPQTTQSSDTDEFESAMPFTNTPESEIFTQIDTIRYTPKDEDKTIPHGTEKDSKPFVSDEKPSDTTEELGLQGAHTTQTSLPNIEDLNKSEQESNEEATEAPESITTFEQSTLAIKEVTTESYLSYTSPEDKLSTMVLDHKEVQKEQQPDYNVFLTTSTSLQPEDYKKITELPMSQITHIDHASQTTVVYEEEMTEHSSETTVKPKLEEEKAQTSESELQNQSTETSDYHVVQQEKETESSTKLNVGDDFAIDHAEKTTMPIMEDEYSIDRKPTTISQQQTDFSKDITTPEIIPDMYTEGTPVTDTKEVVINTKSPETTTVLLPITDVKLDLSHKHETPFTESIDESVTKLPQITQTVQKEIITTPSILLDDEHLKETISTEAEVFEQLGLATEYPETDIHDMHSISPEKETAETEKLMTETPEISTEKEFEPATSVYVVPTVAKFTEKPMTIVTEINESVMHDKDHKQDEIVTYLEEETTKYVNLEETTEKDILYTHSKPLYTTEAQNTITQSKESNTEALDRATTAPDQTITDNLDKDKINELISPHSSTQIPEISTSISLTQTEATGIDKTTFTKETPSEEEKPTLIVKEKEDESQPEKFSTQSTVEKEIYSTESTPDLSQEKVVTDVHIPSEFMPTTSEKSYTEAQTTQTHKEFDVIGETKPTTEQGHEFSETTPFLIELNEHTHQIIDKSSRTPVEEILTTPLYEPQQTERGDQNLDVTEKYEDENQTSVPIKVELEQENEEKPIITHGQEQVEDEVTTMSSITVKNYTDRLSETVTIPTSSPTLFETEIQEKEEYTTTVQDVILTTSAAPQTVSEKESFTTISTDAQNFTYPVPESSSLTTEKDILLVTEEPLKSEASIGTTLIDDELLRETSKTTTSKIKEETTTHSLLTDKSTQLEEKPFKTTPSPSTQELTKPEFDDEISEGIPSPDFPPSGAGGYGQEPDYIEEDQAFGPGTCRYGGKMYVSAQQIPRDDPCDFCFCFRSDIICLQQSCPPPIHGCHEEPIQGFCCPRYECPVSMATTLNVTTTTTTTTTTLPPHFLPHAYKGAAQRRGCQIKGHIYKVGEVVRASSGPCLHCTCGGDGQMKCDPKACTPEPMLRQMIAAAVSAKRRR